MSFTGRMCRIFSTGDVFVDRDLQVGVIIGEETDRYFIHWFSTIEKDKRYGPLWFHKGSIMAEDITILTSGN